MKMTFEEWLSENSSDIEREYQLLHDEYGDAMNLLSEFKIQKYKEYLEIYEMSTRCY
jgi:hypothetical protein